MNKISSIHILRGLAASLVCLCHFATGSPDYLPDGNVIKIVGVHSVYGVQIFFVISGFILPYSLYKSGYHLRDFGNFLIRRVVRIDPPYLISILIVLVLAYISTLSPFYRGGPFQFFWKDTLLHLGYLNALFNRPWLSPVYWTLAIEFQFYILLGVFFTLFKESKLLIRVLVVTLFFSLSLIFSSRSLIFCHAPIFFMGIFTFLYYEKLIDLYQFLGVIFVATLVGIYSFSFEGTMFGFFTVGAILFIKGQNRFLFFIGNISYSLYLLHVPIGSRITNLTEALTTNVNIRLLMIVVAYAASVFAAYVFYKVIEQRAIQWSKRIQH
ncbi:MAG TPA: acyltransferase [Cyclobacteriaceae bacterium]